MSARRTIVVAGLLTAALQLAPPPALGAQGTPAASGSRSRAPQADRRTPRKVVFSIAGALVGAAATAFYFAPVEAGERGNCSTRNCVVPVSVVGSAFVGYLVGREFDQLHALRYRGGRPLSPSAVSVILEGEPAVLAASDSLVAVGGLGGVQLFTSGPSSLRAGARRAAGVRGISALALAPGSAHVGIGAASGFYLYPPGTAPGALVRDGAASAAVPAPGDRMYVAVGNRVEVVPVGADTVRTWPGIDLGVGVGALAYDAARSIVWALADSALMALRPDGDSLTLVGTTRFDAPGRRVVVDGQRLGIAFGEAGVRLYDATSPAAVRETVRWTGARFAYDLSFGADRLFVAAGLEGVYVLDASGPTLSVAGLARELGFATALATRGEYTFVLDRGGNALRRIRSDF